MAKKAKPSASAAKIAHTEALRENTRAVKQHTKILKTAIETHAALAEALDNHAAAVMVAAKLSLTVIKQRLEQVTGPLLDTDKVINMLGGDGGMRDTLISRINNKFWPGAAAPHLTFDMIKGMDVATLVKTIQAKL